MLKFNDLSKNPKKKMESNLSGILDEMKKIQIDETHPYPNATYLKEIQIFFKIKKLQLTGPICNAIEKELREINLQELEGKLESELRIISRERGGSQYSDFKIILSINREKIIINIGGKATENSTFCLLISAKCEELLKDLKLNDLSEIIFLK